MAACDTVTIAMLGLIGLCLGGAMVWGVFLIRAGVRKTFELLVLSGPVPITRVVVVGCLAVALFLGLSTVQEGIVTANTSKLCEATALRQVTFLGFLLGMFIFITLPRIELFLSRRKSD